MNKKDIDNILKANKKLDWVKRLYEENTPSIVLPGQDYPSTHYMESSDNLVYPTIIRNADGKLEYLGNKARDYAIKTNTAIKFDTEEDAAWFGENYKQGTDVLKEFKLGGNIMKKKKIKIPKYAPGGFMGTGDTVPLADSNMLQGYDSGMSSIPDYSNTQSQGMSNASIAQMTGGIAGGIGTTMGGDVQAKWNEKNPELVATRNAAAQTNPFVAMGKGFNDMITGIGAQAGGEKGRATAQSIVDPLVAGLSHLKDKNLTAGQKALQFLPFGNFALPDTDARFEKIFEEKKQGSNLNFGVAKYGGVIKYKDGGLVNTSSEDFKQFNTESHEEGGQYIDKNKNPTNNPDKAVAEIEKKENSYKDYIFSDTLLYKGNKTFANQADKINKKYKDREDVISKNSLDIELTELMKSNEKQRQFVEEQDKELLANVMRFGGNIQKYPNGGKIQPIYTDNPKDKRLQAYNDSLNLFNKSKINDKLMSSGEYSPSEWLDYINGKINIEGNNGLSLSKSWEALKKYNGIGPTPIKVNSYLNDDIHVNMFKKPVQPVILKKEVKVPVPKVDYLKNLPTEQDSKIDLSFPEQQAPNEDLVIKGNPIPDYLIQHVKTPNGMKTYKRKDTNSPWLEQEQYKNGGIIKRYSNELMKKNEKIKQQVEQQTQLVQNIMRNGSYLPKATNGLKIPSELEGNVYNDWSNLMYSNSGIYPNDESGNMDAGNKITGKYKSSAHLFQDWVNNKYKALPKYGADGLWGKESQSAWDNYGDEYRKLISDKNSVGIGTGIAPINKPLFDYTNPVFNPSQDINGIDIEPSNDNYGTGIGVDNSVKQNKTITSKNKPSALEIAGYGIKGAELLGHAIQAFKKPDYVKPVYNSEENNIKSIMKNRSVDVQSILNELDLQEAGAKENIKNNSTSVGVMQANLQKLNANNVNAITKTKFDEQLQNNQYRADEAQVLNNLGQQKMSAQVYAEDVNAKAKANVQMQRDKFLKESIGGLGDFILKKDYVNKDNEFQMNILKSKGINFEATDYKDWNKAGVDIAKFTGELESETDTAKRKAKMEEVHQKFLAKGGTEEAWQSNSIAQGLTNKYLK